MCRTFTFTFNGLLHIMSFESLSEELIFIVERSDVEGGGGGKFHSCGEETETCNSAT